MASSLFALLDDIATLLDDIAVLTKVAAQKTAGVLGDDAEAADGGSPVSTKESRRLSTPGSAGGAGWSLAANNAARTKRSTGSFDHAPSSTFGASIFRMGLRLHQSRRF